MTEWYKFVVSKLPVILNSKLYAMAVAAPSKQNLVLWILGTHNSTIETLTSSSLISNIS